MLIWRGVLGVGKIGCLSSRQMYQSLSSRTKTGVFFERSDVHFWSFLLLFFFLSLRHSSLMVTVFSQELACLHTGQLNV